MGLIRSQNERPDAEDYCEIMKRVSENEWFTVHVQHHPLSACAIKRDTCPFNGLRFPPLLTTKTSTSVSCATDTDLARTRATTPTEALHAPAKICQALDLCRMEGIARMRATVR